MFAQFFLLALVSRPARAGRALAATNHLASSSQSAGIVCIDVLLAKFQASNRPGTGITLQALDREGEIHPIYTTIRLDRRAVRRAPCEQTDSEEFILPDEIPGRDSARRAAADSLIFGTRKTLAIVPRILAFRASC